MIEQQTQHNMRPKKGFNVDPNTPNLLNTPQHPTPKLKSGPLRVTDIIFSDEKYQKMVLTILAVLVVAVLTWELKTSNTLNPGVRSNLASILWFALLFFFFQVYEYLFALASRLFNAYPSAKSNFMKEFWKFFFSFNSVFICTETVLGGGTLRMIRVLGPLNYLMYYGILSLVAATIFYRVSLLKDLALKSRVAQAEAQYSLLETQMQPHFLFNSLNVLSELIYVDPDMANSMSQKLADLYREILHNSKNKFCSLESELSILSKYVEIQKIRFGDRVRFHMKVESKYKNLLVPSLMLQTLVENAIKHGVSPKKDGGDIFFDIIPSGNRFEISISNTGQLYKGHETNKRSTGLQNTQNRLDLIYGNKHDFKIYSDEKMTYVKFKITGRVS